MWHRGLRGESYTRLFTKCQTVFSVRAEDVALTCRIRLCGTNGCVEKPITTARRSDDARRLYFQLIQRSRALHPCADLFSPFMKDRHFCWQSV